MIYTRATDGCSSAAVEIMTESFVCACVYLFQERDEKTKLRESVFFFAR